MFYNLPILHLAHTQTLGGWLFSKMDEMCSDMDTRQVHNEKLQTSPQGPTHDHLEMLLGIVRL